ncbi:ester cyclase [Hyalangium versicolor]|uniref:ester cyclase n=1 Tax=Hyalangium versicolor TaxID=2861190 RepID=UPI001CCA11EC|nr:ester cyclase [Hyalangium versicolor]
MTGLWDKHLEAEFAHKSPAEALATMTSNPRVTIVPTMIGGRGTEELHTFYAKHFLNQLPPDIEVVPVSRTVGQGRVVDELVIKFTHTVQMDWVLPSVPPTGKRIEFAMVVIVYTEGDRISAENLYWDSATILRQAGLLPDPKLPVLGAESARNMLSHTAPLNELIRRTQR